MPLRRHRIRLGLMTAMVALATSRAEAHTVFSASGPFFGGIKHFFLSPDDILAAVAFGLLLGLRGVPGRTVFALPATWLLAGAIALLAAGDSTASAVPPACTLMALGLLLATNLTLPSRALLLAGLLVGGLHGWLNGTALREAGPGTALAQLSGVAVSALVTAFYPVALLDLVKLERGPWIRIVVRVLGSWIAASGLLLLGWSLRAGR